MLYEKVRGDVGASDTYTNIYDKTESQVLNLYDISFGNRYVLDTPVTDYSLKRITYPTGALRSTNTNRIAMAMEEESEV